jgi:hypothetical protein
MSVRCCLHNEWWVGGELEKINSKQLPVTGFRLPGLKIKILISISGNLVWNFNSRELETGNW